MAAVSADRSVMAGIMKTHLDSHVELDSEDTVSDSYDSNDEIVSILSESWLDEYLDSEDFDVAAMQNERTPRNDTSIIDLGLFHVWVEPTAVILSRKDAWGVLNEMKQFLNLYMESTFAMSGYQSIVFTELEEIEFHPISESDDEEDRRYLSRKSDSGASILHVSGMEIEFENAQFALPPTILELREELSLLVSSTFDQCHDDDKLKHPPIIIDLYWSEERPIRDCEDRENSQSSALDRDDSHMVKLFLVSLPIVLFALFCIGFVLKRKKDAMALTSDQILTKKLKSHEVTVDTIQMAPIRLKTRSITPQRNQHESIFPLQLPKEISANSRSTKTFGSVSTDDDNDVYNLRKWPLYIRSMRREHAQSFDCIGTSGLDFGTGISFGGSPTYTRHQYDIDAKRHSDHPEGTYVACESDQEDCSSLSGGSVSSGDSSNDTASFEIV